MNKTTVEIKVNDDNSYTITSHDLSSDFYFIAGADIARGDFVEFRRARDRKLRRVWPSKYATGYSRVFMWLDRFNIWPLPTLAGVALTSAIKGERVRVSMTGPIGRVSMTGPIGRGYIGG